MNITAVRNTRIPLAVIALFCSGLLLGSGCSSDKTTSLPFDAHPDGWMNAESPDFHGQAVLADGLAECTQCHGVDLTGGKAGSSCFECHGPGSDDCVRCHGGRYDSTGAPPYGLRGEVAESEIAVGAHRWHLMPVSLADGFECAICHTVPLFVWDSSHFDYSAQSGSGVTDSIAEITWGGIAPALGATWDRDTETCSNTYCHGNFPGGNVANAPVWTAEKQDTCGSCHDTGFEPSRLAWSGHVFHVGVTGLDCGLCHHNVVDSALHITGREFHINGAVDTLIRDASICAACHESGNQSCAFCHGGVDNLTGAPPRGLRNELSTGSLAVGAHTVHLGGGIIADSVSCEQCHTVPGTIDEAGHLGVDSVAEITWGRLAGSSSSWNRTSATCSSTYCHGNFPGGDTLNAPMWTGADQAECGSCHDVGEDPASLGWKHEYHASAGLECVECHANVVNEQLDIIDLTRHVNGEVNRLTRDTMLCNNCHGTAPDACNYCHGGIDNQTGAPPKGLRGETLTSTLAVGAHTRHLEGGVLADSMACTECHRVPFILTFPGHLDADSVAELTWGALAGNQSSWDRGSATCSMTYCHGNFSGGNNANAPVWTASNQAGCGSCHDDGVNPSQLSGRHEKHVDEEGLPCYRCHATTVNASLDIISTSAHVNGAMEVEFSSGLGFYSNGSCAGLGPGCHDIESWF